MHTKCVINKIQDYQLTLSDSGGVFSNRDTLTQVSYTLPDNAPKGVIFHFCVQDILAMNIVPGNILDQIIDTSSPILGQGLYADVPGENITLVSNGSRLWLTMNKFGFWIAGTL
jgi:hypothetical protein